MITNEDEGLTLMEELAPHSIDHKENWCDDVTGCLLAALIVISTELESDTIEVARETLQEVRGQVMQHAEECEGC